MAVIALTFLSLRCDLGESPSLEVEPLSAIFKVTDTTGREATTFRTGENFDLLFVLTNTTGKRLSVFREDSGPDAIFSIVHRDSVVAASVHGYGVHPVATINYIEPGKALQDKWRAPNTPARNPKIVLAPNLYQAHVTFRRFEEVRVKEVSPISFSIVQRGTSFESAGMHELSHDEI